MKEFRTIKEQIELLKLRGLKFNSEENAEQILLTNNYYNVINGYKELFVEEDNKDMFKKNVTFEEIYALYEFDRQLRTIFLEYILKIENSLRTLVAYYFSFKHGNDNYLKLDNFNTFNEENVSSPKKENQLKLIQNLIGNINKKIALSIGNTPYIKHYIMTYGFVPLWVLVNILSFGDICSFLKLMKQNERVEISRHYNILESDLTNLLGILCYTRNLCAHDERLYNYKFPSNNTINDNYYHSFLMISKQNDRFISGKNDLFAVVLALKLLLNASDYEKFHSKLFSRIMSLQSRLKSIDFKLVLNSMNFPENWNNIKKCPKPTRGI